MAQGNGQTPEVVFDPERDIVIKLMPGPDGNNIRLMAPLNNKIYCLGLLKLAEQAVISFVPPKPSDVVQAPASALEGLPDFQIPKRGR